MMMGVFKTVAKSLLHYHLLVTRAKMQIEVSFNSDTLSAACHEMVATSDFRTV